MADKNTARNWKHGKYIPMVRLTACLLTDQPTWGNPSKKGVYRCTKCGKEHS